MREGYVIKLSDSIIRVILAISFVLFFPLAQTISNGYTQSQRPANRSDQIKAALLRPDGWYGVWSGSRDSGQSKFIFEDRRDKVAVIIKDLAGDELSCERDVTITSDVVKFDDCRDRIVTLRFDPNNDVYPFQGSDSAGYKFTLTGENFIE
jgi:hypothetical protein